ncbi:MAG: ATP-binding protein [Candidatus Auribacter fodinae]|jgi:Mrp family chromosome partitioning ATPase|uniref:Iron-sulfur cluster carrier protein n=1 Tax=Candidatus Auribacter fodinae TaxID=2093366 RepID=A0A3A4QV63_9BACT|nr:MAG: ATP-binding protein [Candidatus Auribacter fodinae]
MDQCHHAEDFISPQIKERMKSIRHTIAVMSNKGGVGKSTVSVNIAVGFAMRNCKVGLLDADLHGPSVFKMLGLEGKKIFAMENQIMPLEPLPNLKVISMAGLIDSCETPLIWRGPLKIKVIEQFLSDVEWGDLDYLIVDLPPGTGDEPLSILQFIPGISGSVIVTTPQEVATLDARKAISFARKLNTPVIGIVENMSGMICPHCKEQIDIFKKSGGKNVSLDMNVPFLGELGFDPQIVDGADAGKSVANSSCSDTVKKQMESILDAIENYFAPEEAVQ